MDKEKIKTLLKLKDAKHVFLNTLLDVKSEV